MNVQNTLYGTIDPYSNLTYTEKQELVRREREYDPAEQWYSNIQELEEFIEKAKRHGLKL